MTPSTHEQKKPYVVLGLGETGLSCIRYLTKQNHAVIAMDTRQDPPGLALLRKQFTDVPVFLGELDEQYILQAHTIVISPGLSLKMPVIQKALQHSIPVIGDIELFARAARAPVVAITGSNAKGTVTTLVGEMATRAGWSCRVGGNIGTPALDLLEATEPDVYVLELSSFQLETTYSLIPKLQLF